MKRALSILMVAVAAILANIPFAQAKSNAVSGTQDAATYRLKSYTGTKYLGFDTYNLAMLSTATDCEFTASTLTTGAFVVKIGTGDKPYLHCGTNGRFSGNAGNDAANEQIFIFKVVDPTAATITANRVDAVEAGGTYVFVGINGASYYALTSEGINVGTNNQRMIGMGVYKQGNVVSFDKEDNESAMWTVEANKTVFYKVNFEQPWDGGTFDVMNGDVAVASGDSLPAGTTLTINTHIKAGWLLDNISVNWKKIDGNKFQLKEISQISVEFGQISTSSDSLYQIVNYYAEQQSNDFKNLGYDNDNEKFDLLKTVSTLTLEPSATKLRAFNIKYAGHYIGLANDFYGKFFAAVGTKAEAIDFEASYVMDINTKDTLRFTNSNGYFNDGQKYLITAKVDGKVYIFTPNNSFSPIEMPANLIKESGEMKYNTTSATNEFDIWQFNLPSYTAKVVAPAEGGTLVVKNNNTGEPIGATVKRNSYVTIIPSEANGYEVKSVKVNGQEIKWSEDNMGYQILGDVEFSAEFAKEGIPDSVFFVRDYRDSWDLDNTQYITGDKYGLTLKKGAKTALEFHKTATPGVFTITVGGKNLQAFDNSGSFMFRIGGQASDETSKFHMFKVVGDASGALNAVKADYMKAGKKYVFAAKNGDYYTVITSNISSTGTAAGGDSVTYIMGSMADVSGDNLTYQWGHGAFVFEKAAYSVTYTQPTVGGTFEVKNGEEAVASGDVVKAGATITVNAHPADGFVTKAITLNGVALTTGNTFVLMDSTNIAVEFGQAAPMDSMFVARSYNNDTYLAIGQYGLTAGAVKDVIKVKPASDKGVYTVELGNNSGKFLRSSQDPGGSFVYGFTTNSKDASAQISIFRITNTDPNEGTLKGVKETYLKAGEKYILAASQGIDNYYTVLSNDVRQYGNVATNDSTTALGGSTATVTGDEITFEWNSYSPAAWVFEVPSYSVTLTNDTPDNGSVKMMLADKEIKSGAEIKVGDVINFTFAPATDCTLDKFIVNGANLLNKVAENKYTYTVDGNLNVTVGFAKEVMYTVNLTNSTADWGGAKMTVDGKEIATGAKVKEGAVVEFTFTPKTDYKVSVFTINGDSKLDKIQNNSFSYTVNANVEAAVKFAPAGGLAANEAGVTAFYNATQQTLNIAGENVSAVVYSLAGAKVVTTTEKVTDLSTLPAGTYLVRVKTTTGMTKVVKFVKK